MDLYLHENHELLGTRTLLIAHETQLTHKI